MNTQLLALFLVAPLAACVATPDHAPPLFVEQSSAHSDAEAQVAALFLSTELAPAHPEKLEDTRSRGVGSASRQKISDTERVVQGFGAGLRNAASDVRLLVADDALRSACFGDRKKSIERPPMVLVAPNLEATQCTALLRQRRIRYLISVTGFRATASQGEPLGLGFFITSTHAFALFAQAFDTTTGSAICADWVSVDASSGWGATLLYLPIPLARLLDESGYWAKAAWMLGDRIGSCLGLAEGRTASDAVNVPEFTRGGSVMLGSGEYCLVVRDSPFGVFCAYQSMEACQANSAASTGRATCAARAALK